MSQGASLLGSCNRVVIEWRSHYNHGSLVCDTSIDQAFSKVLKFVHHTKSDLLSSLEKPSLRVLFYTVR